MGDGHEKSSMVSVVRGQFHVLGRADQAKYSPYARWRPLLVWVAHNAGIGKGPEPSSVLHLAAARCKDVPYPVAFRAVGERNTVAISGAKRVDGRPVGPA